MMIFDYDKWQKYAWVSMINPKATGGGPIGPHIMNMGFYFTKMPTK